MSTRTAVALPNRIDALAVTRAGDQLLVFARIRRTVAENFWAGSLEAFPVDANGQSAGDAFTILAIERSSTLVAFTRRTSDSVHGASVWLFVRVAPFAGARKSRAVRQ